MGKVIAVCTSEKKGTLKKDVGSALLIKDHGLQGDAHAGSQRQVSLLSYESFQKFRSSNEGLVDIYPGVFGENLLVSGYDLKTLRTGTRFKCGECILELTQIGKKCHTGCEISRIAGKCIMPLEGVFARVIEGGTVRNGDEIVIIPCILVSSDRSYRGEREDLSGPKIKEILSEKGYEVIDTVLLPDDKEDLEKELIRMCDEVRPDVIFTSGGTGFSPRDNMPEATLKAAHRQVPGISEAIRAYSLQITPNAMLSRGVSVIRNKTLIVNLPGSHKAASEILEYILPVLGPGLPSLRGEVVE